MPGKTGKVSAMGEGTPGRGDGTGKCPGVGKNTELKGDSVVSSNERTVFHPDGLRLKGRLPKFIRLK